ncbi:MAG: FKBP-type peptidyl-prolyl cis-trans isomerase [Clostridiales bacterium]|nr:FKBP-type peptidyl-prolyl cis-trans isomerase [Clostridiales bacterium]
MSKESRLAAKKRSAQAAKKRMIRKICKIAAIIMIPVIIICIGFAIYLNNLEKNVTSSSFVNNEGKIKGKAAKNYVTLCDYKNITLNREDNLPTKTELQNAVDAEINSHKETVDKDGTELKADSTVNLNYSVTVDGKELTDKKAENKSYVLGSNNLTKAFDDAVAKLKVGDSFDIEVTFPSDYSDSDLKDKKAKLAGKVVSVVVVPELTDAFVADKMKEEMKDSSYPLTVQGMKDFLANNIYEQKLESSIEEYLIEKTTVKSYPWLYTKAQFYLQDKNYVSTMNYYNQMFGREMYKQPADMLGLKSNKEYKNKLKEDARGTVKYYLTYQAIFEDAGLEKITEEEVKSYIAQNGTSSYDELVKANGYPCLAQAVLREKAFEHVKELVKVNGDTSKMYVDDPATPSDAEKK